VVAYAEAQVAQEVQVAEVQAEADLHLPEVEVEDNKLPNLERIK